MHITVLPQRKQIEIAGRRRAADVLRELGFLPGTAMVIRRDELVPEGAMLEADDVVEVRSVISGGRDASGRLRMKCTRCKAPAEVELRQHNAGFCRACFVFYFQRQVERAIDKERMFSRGRGGAGRRLRRQGQPGAVGRADRARLPDHRAASVARDRRVLGSVDRQDGRPSPRRAAFR